MGLLSSCRCNVRGLRVDRQVYHTVSTAIYYSSSLLFYIYHRLKRICYHIYSMIGFRGTCFCSYSKQGVANPKGIQHTFRYPIFNPLCIYSSINCLLSITKFNNSHTFAPEVYQSQKIEFMRSILIHFNTCFDRYYQMIFSMMGILSRFCLLCPRCV